MSVNDLPIEILQNILQRLYGFEVIRCRAVCRRWRDVVDDMPDSYWKRICRQDHLRDEYATAHKKYGLSWCDVYKALQSWHNIRIVSMEACEVDDNIQHFKVLPHGVLSLLKNKRHYKYPCYSDTIVYYNLETSQVCGREEFQFAFSSDLFEENENFWVLIKHDGTLAIVLKANKKQYCVGKLPEYGILHFTKIALIDNEVYFQSDDDKNMIYMSKLVSEDGVIDIITEPLEAFKENYDSFEESVVAYSKKDGFLYIFSYEGNIYIHENADFSFISKIDMHCWDILHEFATYGFDWRSRGLLEWLAEATALVDINPFLSVFYSHGKVILMADPFSTSVNILFTYWVGGIDTQRIVRYRAKRRIDMKKMINYSKPFRGIENLDIVETENSHKVLVLVQSKLFVFEFPHCVERMVLRSMTRKREEAKNTNSTEQMVPEKKQKTKKQNGNLKIKLAPSTKRYATRSNT